MSFIGWTGELRVASIFSFDDFVLSSRGTPPGTIAPAGIDAGAFGTPTVLHDRLLRPVGFLAFGGFGSASIDHLDRHIHPAGFTDETFGTLDIEDFIRTLDVPHIDATTYGSPLVSFNPRYILPDFIPATSYGAAVVDQTHFVDPTGFDAASIGTAFVHDNRQFPQIEGFHQDAYGLPFVSHSPRILLPQGFPSTDEYALPSERWGRPEMHSNLQIIQQVFEVTPSDGGVFGDYVHTFVENRNRAIGAQGWRDDRFGSGASVLNNARAIVPDGFDATLFGNQLVAWRDRPLPVPAIEPGQIGEYTVVFNAARLLQPAGSTHTLYGRPSVVNTRRYFPYITAGDQASLGTAFVAFAIRTVLVPLGVEGIVGTPAVALKTRYVTPAGLDPGDQWGGADLRIHRNIIAPNPVPFHPDTIGFPTVLNRNRAIGMYGLDQAIYGRPLVENKIRYLHPTGQEWATFGNSPVAYRNRTLTVFGFDGSAVGSNNHVAKTTPDPPFDQVVFAAGFDAAAVGAPTVRSNSIYPAGVIGSSYGTATVRTNVIRPNGFFTSYVDRWGVPSFNGTQYVSLPSRGIAAPDDPLSGFAPTKHRLSPYTIYATFNVTAQAVANNGGAWEYVDRYLVPDDGSSPSARPFFGGADVSHRNRTVSAAGNDSAALGNPTLFLRKRVLAPAGINQSRLGFPIMGPFPHTAGPVAFGGETFGAAVVRTIDLHRHLFPSGFAESFGVASVDLFNREVHPVGWDSFTMTDDEHGVPYGPVLSTRVHFPEPVKPVGSVMTQWGFDEGGSVDFRIRHMNPSGWDSFTEGYTPGQFNDRMRVKRSSSGIQPHGFAAGAFGIQAVSHG